MTAETSALAEEVAAMRWYQSMALPGGIVTPGDYDMANALARIPFPATLAGKRCLDVGTRDGFWAFEMERRGAAEVVATDLASQAEADLAEPHPPLEAGVRSQLDARNASFELAHRALGSGVRWRALNVYDLSPEAVGRFDFAFIGTLLLHLRSPLDALRAIRGVLGPAGVLMSNNPISLPLTLSRPRWPAADLVMKPGLPYFYVPNARGHVRMVEGAGFRVESATRPYLFRYGPGWERRRVRWRAGSVLQQASQLYGAPHTCVVARPGDSA